MARYSSHLKGAGDFAIQTVQSFVAELDIARWFDQGEALVLATITIRNDAAGVRSPFCSIFFDGSNFGPLIRFADIPAGEFDTRTFAFLISITEGQHTFRLSTTGETDATQFIPAFGASLSVIQLPQWDNSNDFVFASL